METTTNQPTEGANTALSVSVEVEDFKAVISAAPDALEKNITMLTKALKQGDEIRIRIDAGEMDDNMDAEINDHMVKLDKALELANGRRTPFTRMMDTIKSRFTGIEKTFKDEKEAFQKVRDGYAMKKRQEEAERQKKAALKLAQEKERIEVRSKLEQEQLSHFEKFLTESKEKLFTGFNKITLDNFEKSEKYLKEYKAEYPTEQFDSWVTFIGSNIISADEINAMVTEFKTGARLKEFCDRFKSEVGDAVTMLTDRLPGKKKELEDQKKAAEEAAKAKAEAERLASEAKSAAEKEAAEKARIEAEARAKQAEEQKQLQAAREKQEAEARAKAEEEAKAKAAAEAQVKVDAEVANTLFSAEMENATEAAGSAKGREGFEIIVKAPPGFMLIFNQWFQNEGKNLTVDQIAKKKIDSLVTFCEKFAHKNPKEKIVSPFIEYIETFKTRTEK